MESAKGTLVDRCRLRIHYGRCVSCSACTATCHTIALVMDALTLELDETLCDNCSLCIRVCPVGALFFYEERPRRAA